MSEIIDAKTLITLQQLQLYAYRQKSKLLSGGRGLPEQDYPDMPQFEDYDNQTSDNSPAEPDIAGLDKIMPLPTPLTAAAIIAPVATSSTAKTLAERVAERKQQSAQEADKQISIDEAVAAADKAATATQAATHTHDNVETVSALAQSAAASPAPDKIPSRLREYYEARVAWRIERWRRRFEDARTKQQVMDECVGYDDMIAYIDKIINDDRKRDTSRIGNDDININ
jgi:hypothetical protein